MKRIPCCLLLLLLLPPRCEAGEVSGVSRAPVAVPVGTISSLPIDPDNGAVDIVACDQNGTICADVALGGDNLANSNVLWTVAMPMLFDGTTYDRQRAGNATNLAAATQEFTAMVTTPGQWQVTHVPAANTQATASKAAGGAAVRHVAQTLTACLGGTLQSALVNVYIRDGATGAGTILWAAQILAPANDNECITLSGLNLLGTANTAMTVECSAAGGVSTNETVTLTGYSVQ